MSTSAFQSRRNVCQSPHRNFGEDLQKLDVVRSLVLGLQVLESTFCPLALKQSSSHQNPPDSESQRDHQPVTSKIMLLYCGMLLGLITNI